MRGNITRRGKASWRLKFDVEQDALTGKRRIRYVTVKGKRGDAKRNLRGYSMTPTKGRLLTPQSSRSRSICGAG